MGWYPTRTGRNARAWRSRGGDGPLPGAGALRRKRTGHARRGRARSRRMRLARTGMGCFLSGA
jgi:hypothetical protein